MHRNVFFCLIEANYIKSYMKLFCNPFNKCSETYPWSECLNSKFDVFV